MTRALSGLLLLSGLVVGFLLVGPFIDPLLSEVQRRAYDPPDPTPLPSGFVEITTHCGLDYAVVEFQGEWWTFDVEDQDGRPAGSVGFGTEVVRVEEGLTGPVVTRPDGSQWTLVHIVPARRQGSASSGSRPAKREAAAIPTHRPSLVAQEAGMAGLGLLGLLVAPLVLAGDELLDLDLDLDPAGGLGEPLAQIGEPSFVDEPLA